MTQNKKIGILFGGGSLPEYLICELQKQNYELTLCGIKPFADENLLQLSPKETLSSSMTKVGKIISFFKSHDISKIVFIGRVTRPDFRNLIPDAKGISLLNRIRKLKKAGDNSVLETVEVFLRESGIELISITDLLPQLLQDKIIIGNTKICEENLSSLEFGFYALDTLSTLDTGQAIIVKDNNILAIEAIDGTNALIRKNGQLDKTHHGGILIKAPKKGQNMKLDIPVIGLETVKLALENNLQAIAVRANSTIIFEIDKIESYIKNKDFSLIVY